MAINRPGLVKFWYQNNNGAFYSVSINKSTGVGAATYHGTAINSTPMYAETEVALAVDSADLADWQGAHDSWRIRADVYNTDNTLEALLTGAGSPLSAPVNTVAPTITGTEEVGSTLTATAGTWTGNPTPTYSYQWYADGEPIEGATSSTYDLTEAEEGTAVHVVVTATNSEGSASAASDPTEAISAGE